MGCVGKWEVLSLCEDDARATSDREKSERRDLRMCWQYIKGEAVNADQDIEIG